jgi:hypothetical protein
MAGEEHQRHVGIGANPAVEGVTAALFGGLARLRGRRIFHPKGAGFDAQLINVGERSTGAELFDRSEPQRAIVRLSRSAGLPEALPDPCGLAIRVPDAYGARNDQDFLLVSSAAPPVARHLLLPSRGFADRPYSSLLPYRIGGQTTLVGALAQASRPGPKLADLDGVDDPPSFRINLATPRGEWVPVADLVLGERRPEVATERLRFNPAHSGGGLEPVGFLNDLRPAAYRGSQAARPV